MLLLLSIYRLLLISNFHSESVIIPSAAGVKLEVETAPKSEPWRMKHTPNL